MSTPDFSEELTHRLSDAADLIGDADRAAVLADVRATAGRRRRRRQGVAGIAAVGALVASGVVVATLTSSNGTDELILSAPPTEPESTAPATAVPDDGTSTGDGVAPDGEPAEASSETEQPVVTEAPVSGEPASGRSFPVRGASVDYLGDELTQEDFVNGFPSQLLAWNGGFLSITIVSEPQALPTELPPEIAEQFPQEVLDLFPDGLPPTIGEATEILQDAGLFEVVSEIVLANPDVSDAIYAQPVNTLATARFSTDGETWEEIEAAIPSEVLTGTRLVSTGDRLAGVSIDGDDLVVRSSTDLVTWDEQAVPAPQRPTDRPAFISYQLQADNLVANGDGWIAQLSAYGDLNMSMLPEGPFDEEIREGRAGYGFGEDGIEFTIGSGPDGQPGPDGEDQTRLVTWEELGVEEAPDMGSLFERSLYAASWDGPVQDVSSSLLDRSGQLLAVDDGFVDLGATPRFSPDGADWVDLDAPFDGYVSWAIETEQGLLMSATDNFGRQGVFALDRSDSTWTEVDITDLPRDSFNESSASRVAVLTEFGDPFSALVSETVSAAEVDGYRFEERTGEGGGERTSTYTVTDIASGDVVSTETVTSDDDFGQDYEFLIRVDDVDDDGEPGFRLLDQATGDVIVVVPYLAITWTRLDENGEELGDDAFSGEFGPDEPNVWIVASSADGVIVQQLESSSAGGFYPVGAARNDDIVLVWLGDGTFARVPLT